MIKIDLDLFFIWRSLTFDSLTWNIDSLEINPLSRHDFSKRWKNEKKNQSNVPRSHVFFVQLKIIRNFVRRRILLNFFFPRATLLSCGKTFLGWIPKRVELRQSILYGVHSLFEFWNHSFSKYLEDTRGLDQTTSKLGDVWRNLSFHREITNRFDSWKVEVRFQEY